MKNLIKQIPNPIFIQVQIQYYLIWIQIDKSIEENLDQEYGQVVWIKFWVWSRLSICTIEQDFNVSISKEIVQYKIKIKSGQKINLVNQNKESTLLQ